jgi:hypothetical protein
LSAAARNSCTPRLSGGNLASCSFKRGRTIDAPFATLTLFVVFFRLFDAAAFRRAALVGLFATPGPRVVAPTLELPRFRFDNLVSTFFILARIVLLVLRATREFDAGLLFATRFRALDEDGPLEARFEVCFTRDADPVLFIFDLVGFFDLLRAAIVNLSTRERYRIRFKSAHEY